MVITGIRFALCYFNHLGRRIWKTVSCLFQDLFCWQHRCMACRRGV